MKGLIILNVLAGSLLMMSTARAENSICPDLFNHELPRLHSSETVNLCSVLAGKSALIVNTASHCGFTPQFEALEDLYQAYKDRGFAVLGVPSNDFKQEAKDEAETASVCFINYGVTFTMVSPQIVRGSEAHPLFQALAEAAGQPGWNFNKYLVDREGRIVERFGSRVKPMSEQLRAAVEAVL